MIKLRFRIDLDYLKNNTYVPGAVKVILDCRDPESLLKIILLGESGMDMAKDGGPFDCDPELAKDLIEAGLAKKVYPRPLYDWSEPNGLFLDWLACG